MHWIAVFLIGLIVGLLARALTPGHGPRGIILTALLGIAGSIIGTWAGQTLGWYAPARPARRLHRLGGRRDAAAVAAPDTDAAIMIALLAQRASSTLFHSATRAACAASTASASPSRVMRSSLSLARMASTTL